MLLKENFRLSVLKGKPVSKWVLLNEESCTYAAVKLWDPSPWNSLWCSISLCSFTVNFSTWRVRYRQRLSLHCYWDDRPLSFWSLAKGVVDITTGHGLNWKMRHQDLSSHSHASLPFAHTAAISMPPVLEICLQINAKSHWNFHSALGCTSGGYFLVLRGLRVTWTCHRICCWPGMTRGTHKANFILTSLFVSKFRC